MLNELPLSGCPPSLSCRMKAAKASACSRKKHPTAKSACSSPLKSIGARVNPNSAPSNAGWKPGGIPSVGSTELLLYTTTLSATPGSFTSTTLTAPLLELCWGPVRPGEPNATSVTPSPFKSPNTATLDMKSCGCAFTPIIT